MLHFDWSNTVMSCIVVQQCQYVHSWLLRVLILFPLVDTMVMTEMTAASFVSSVMRAAQHL